ncbi:hypothetical protein [Nostoc sp.]|uniref:hypothetical protein n=1 Tax=Nostoc sp. TaxID=1180 RepID=UPI002FF4E9B0
MTSSCNSSANLAMSTTGYAYAGNPEFDTQVRNQKFIFIFGLKKNLGVKIQD